MKLKDMLPLKLKSGMSSPRFPQFKEVLVDWKSREEVFKAFRMFLVKIVVEKVDRAIYARRNVTLTVSPYPFLFHS